MRLDNSAQTLVQSPMSLQITLSSQQEKFVQAQLAQGKFQSAEAVIERALKLLEVQQQAYEAWVDEVRDKVKVAAEELARGEGIPLEVVVGQLQEKFRNARQDQE